MASPSYTLPVSLVHVCAGAQRTKVNIRYEQCVTLQLPRWDFKFFPFKKNFFFLLNLLGGGGTGVEDRWEGMGKWEVGSRYKMLDTYGINLKTKSSSTSLKQSLNWMQNPLILLQLTIFLLGSYIFSWMLDGQMGCNTHPRYMSNSSSGSCFLHDKLFNNCATSLSLFYFLFWDMKLLCSPGLPQSLLLLAFIVLGLQVWGHTQT